MTTQTTKTGASKVPNVFIIQACGGNKSDAAKAWVTPSDRLNGFAPFEVWSNPELLLSEEDRTANPTAGPLTLVATRTKIVRTVKSDDALAYRLTPASVPAPDLRDLLAEAPTEFRSQPVNGNGNGNAGGHAAVSRLVEDIRRRKRSRRY